MLKILLLHWWTISRRTFDWKRLGILAYIVFCFAIGLWVGSKTGGSSLSSLFHHSDSMYYIVPLVVGLSGTEVLMKLVMKRDVVGMDDYVRTKPIARHTWNMFLLVLNLVDYFNWFIPIVVLIVACLGLPLGYALLAFGLSLLISMTDGLLITAHRLTQGWMYKLVLWLAWLVYYVVAACYIALLMPLLSPVWRVVGWAFVTLLFAVLLFIYMCGVHNYADYGQQRPSSVRLTSRSLLGMEWLMLMRVKRLRTAFLLLLLVFTLQVYLGRASDGSSFHLEASRQAYPFIPIFFPSMILGQYIFGVEGNFFHGLLTKPLLVEGMLRRKYLFFIQLNLLSVVVLLPGVFYGYWTLLQLLSLFIFSVGCNLLFFPTCLFSRRLDLSGSAFFNYQGASWSINLYSLVSLLPLAIVFLLFSFIHSMFVVQAILVTMGCLLLCLSPMVLRVLARRFMAKRHQRMETFNQ